MKKSRRSRARPAHRLRSLHRRVERIESLDAGLQARARDLAELERRVRLELALYREEVKHLRRRLSVASALVKPHTSIFRRLWWLLTGRGPEVVDAGKQSEEAQS